MSSKINEYLNSDNEALREVGYFLYRRNNGEKGLSPDDTYELIGLIGRIYNEEDFGRELEMEYTRGFSDGFDEAKRYYENT